MAFNVYRSSAGSGKTFTLVRDYLKLLLREPRVLKHILAVTFTNKAADEMKQRIIRNLAEMSLSKDVHSLPMAKALTSVGLDAETLQEKSLRALNRILHDYNDFSVGTIDSFMHRLVRTFARDMDIPAHFELGLETSETEKLVSEVLLERLGEDEGLTRILIDFLSSQFDQQQSMDYESRIREYVTHLLKEDARPYLDRLEGFDQQAYQTLRKLLDQRLASREEAARELGEKARLRITAAGLEYADFQEGKFGPLAFFEKMARQGMDALPPGSKVTKVGLGGTWYHKKAAADRQATIVSMTPELNSFWEQTMALSNESRLSHKNDQKIRKHLYLLALAARIRQVLLELRYDQQHLPISDINSLVAEIALNESVPFIYERLGERYRHFLLDEFQDTSILQWHNLVPLLENALAEGGGALVVGDGKQSIYRWRSGDATQFRALPDLWVERDYPQRAAREKSLRQHYQSHPLETNYRSAEGLVCFNNDFFRFASAYLAAEVEDTYQELKQEAFLKGKPYYLEVQFLEKGEEERERIFHTPVLNRVREISQSRPLSEIAVLCRSNDLGSSLAQYLLENGIPVLSAESVLLGASPRVRSLTSLIRLLGIRPERLYMAELIRDMHLAGLLGTQPLQDLWRESGVEQRSIRTGPFFDWLRSVGYDFNLSFLRSLSLYDLCEQIIRIFGYDRLSDVYIQFLLEILLEYLDGNDGSLEGFLYWWDETGCRKSVSVPPGMDAVRIMTIHKAKGLEFPVVIYPVKDAELKITQNEKWVDLDPAEYAGLDVAYISLTKDSTETKWASTYESEIAKSRLDLLNIHYVAMTRASTALFVLLEEKKAKASPEAKALQDMRLSALMRAYLLDKPGSEADDLYRFGHWPEETQAAATKLIQAPFDLISVPWSHRLALRLSAPEYWVAGKQEDAVGRGLMVHRVMAAIQRLPDIPSAIQAEVIRGNLQEEMRPELEEQIRRLLSHPDLAPYYGEAWTVKNETAILLPGGQILRPDRVVIQGSEAVVIDYKTGRPDEKHLGQIRQYAQTLREMGYVVKTSILAYLDEGETVKVA